MALFHAQLKACTLQEAAQMLEASLALAPQAQAAYNLVICAFATGDAHAMRRAFSILVQVCDAVAF